MPRPNTGHRLALCINILADAPWCALANSSSVRSHIGWSGYMRISAPALGISCSTAVKKCWNEGERQRRTHPRPRSFIPFPDTTRVNRATIKEVVSKAGREAPGPSCLNFWLSVGGVGSVNSNWPATETKALHRLLMETTFLLTIMFSFINLPASCSSCDADRKVPTFLCRWFVSRTSDTLWRLGTDSICLHTHLQPVTHFSHAQKIPPAFFLLDKLDGFKQELSVSDTSWTRPFLFNRTKQTLKPLSAVASISIRLFSWLVNN